MFVAAAGCGDCSMYYIGTDDACRGAGGFEPTWSFIDPCEQRLKGAMSRLLDA
jgi:hypothetical protein